MKVTLGCNMYSVIKFVNTSPIVYRYLSYN